MDNELDFEKFKQIYDREVVKLMRDSKVPGFSVLITKDGETVYERSFGTREWEGSKPANSDTLYGIASMTKSITSFAVLQLHEKDKLDINDPISDYIQVDLDIDKDNPIRIRHLMAHASGVPNLGTYGVQIKNEDLTQFNTVNLPMGTWEDFYFHVNDAKEWVLFRPEEKFFYNNDAYTMLSQIVAKASGQEFENYVKENIFEPLDMTRSTFSREELEADDNASKGYSYEKQEKDFIRKPKPHLSGKFQSGAGGLNSSVKELTKYLQMHLNEGTFNGKRILAKDLIREMYKKHNQNIDSENIYLNPTGKRAYGYGLSVEEFFDQTLIQHSGASGVSGGVVALIPELNITYVHLYNVGWFSSHMMLIAMHYLLGNDPYESVPFLQRRDHFKKLTGKYANYRKHIVIDVKFENGLLNIEFEVVEKTKVPLVQKNTSDILPMEFYQYTPMGRMTISFFEQNDKIFIKYERDIFKKLSYEEELEGFH